MSDLRREALFLVRTGAIVGSSAVTAKTRMAELLRLPKDSASLDKLPDECEHSLSEKQLQVVAACLPPTAINVAAYRLCMRLLPRSASGGADNAAAGDGTGADDHDSATTAAAAELKAFRRRLPKELDESLIRPYRFSSTRIDGVPDELAPPREAMTTSSSASSSSRNNSSMSNAAGSDGNNSNATAAATTAMGRAVLVTGGAAGDRTSSSVGGGNLPLHGMRALHDAAFIRGASGGGRGRGRRYGSGASSGDTSAEHPAGIGEEDGGDEDYVDGEFQSGGGGGRGTGGRGGRRPGSMSPGGMGTGRMAKSKRAPGRRRSGGQVRRLL